MNNPIVSRLMRNHTKLEFLAEDVNPLYEADADEEYAALNKDEDDEEEEDDSTAPEQGSPDDEIPEDDSTAPEQGDADDPEPEVSVPSHAPSSHSAPTEAPEGEEAPPEQEAPEPPSPDEKVFDNPLDNDYAIHFTLGDDIQLAYEGDTQEQVRTGVIDGYDPEGFYRIKWADGTSTNGITDIAIAEFVRSKKEPDIVTTESKCVCGSTTLVEENNYIICDCCGRKIRESKEDPLMLADKSRPKGKRMIRSEAHPMSTAVKPNIAEAIKKAMAGEARILEEDDPEIEEGAFDALKQLDNEFWTRKEELRRDIEELGYQVDELNAEYVVVSSEDDEENAYKVPIGGTSRTMTLELSKARMI